MTPELSHRAGRALGSDAGAALTPDERNAIVEAVEQADTEDDLPVDVRRWIRAHS